MASKKGVLTENEKKLLESVQKKNVDDVKRLLQEKDVSVNCLDEHGMTPLQHAAYKGDKELCDILLDHGADVNSNFHDHGYTALMFAALSGNVAVTSTILQAGGSTTAVNSVGRTASQMAAFVGNHTCVSIILTYVPKEDIDYYTKPQGLETEAKLPAHLSGIFHRFIMRLNVHPVGTVAYLQQNQALLDEATKVARVLELISEKQMKKTETNEVLAFKLHLFAYIVKSCQSVLQESNKGEGDTKNWDKLDELIKLWVKGRPEDGFSESVEKFLRQGIREFRFTDSTILQQLVRNLAPVEIGDEPSAFTLINGTINGQKAATAEDLCDACGECNAAKTCSACKSVQYCNQRCQKLRWPTHKKYCARLAEEFSKVKLSEETAKLKEEKAKLEEEKRSLEEEKAKLLEMAAEKLQQANGSVQEE